MGIRGSFKGLPVGAVADFLERLPLVGRGGALSRRLDALDGNARFELALGVSFVLHAFVVFGIGVKGVDPRTLQNTAPPLEVVLVNARTQAAPHKADALAQANLDGGGNTDADRRAKSPLPVVSQDRQVSDLSMQQQRVQQLEREARQLMTAAKSKKTVESAPAQPQQQAEAVPAPTGADLMNRSFEIARLEAQISKDWDAYQKRPRRTFLGARTQEFRFARYVEDWRTKVERVGEMNYPADARGQRQYAQLLITVHIKADGQLEKVEINRSSGRKVFDDAAVRIVQLAAPYAPFPPDILDLHPGRPRADGVGVSRP
jgi:protein TonB